MCRPVLTGTLLCQLDFIWRGIIGVDREIAVIYAVAFSAADHSCAETDEKNRFHRVSGRLYKVGFIWVGPMTASSSRHWLDAILPYFIPDMESIKPRRNGLGFRPAESRAKKGGLSLTAAKIHPGHEAVAQALKKGRNAARSRSPRWIHAGGHR